MNKTRGFSEIISSWSLGQLQSHLAAHNPQINIKQRLIIVPKHVTSTCRKFSHNCLNHCVLLHFHSDAVSLYLFLSVSSSTFPRQLSELPTTFHRIAAEIPFAKYRKFPQDGILILLLYYHIIALVVFISNYCTSVRVMTKRINSHIRTYIQTHTHTHLYTHCTRARIIHRDCLDWLDSKNSGNLRAK